MYISQNLQYLRKRDKITQEELADRLGVSRQSVSKWETGEAYPETDKLVTICDVFGVTLDELMRTDLTESPSADSAEAFDRRVFVSQMNKFSKAIAMGVFLIILGVSICVALAGYSFALNERYAELCSIMGGVAVLLFVAVAVFMFIFYGANYDKYRKEQPLAENVYDDKEVKAFAKKFNLAMACLVSGIIVDVIFLILLTSFIDADLINVARQDEACCYVTAAFLLVLSFLVGGLVYYGIQHTKYFTEEYNKQNKKELSQSPRSKLTSAISSAIMLTATALFLILGFVGGWWHPAWVVFPVGGILCGIISAIMGAKDD